MRWPRGRRALLLRLVSVLAVGATVTAQATDEAPSAATATKPLPAAAGNTLFDGEAADIERTPEASAPKWTENDAVFTAKAEGAQKDQTSSMSNIDRSSPSTSSVLSVCDVHSPLSTYRYVPSSIRDKEPATCAVDTDFEPSERQKQTVVVESINKQLKEVLPEVETVNFAAASDGAKVLAANTNAKRVNALLDDDTDTFMRNDCKDDDKWVVIELSQVAKVSRIELSQYELYSSRVHEFAVYGMHSHPRTLSGSNTNGWHFLGKFAAEKKKGLQGFSIQGPLEGSQASANGSDDPRERWVRYVLIRFLSHHGGEKICAINEIGVYGVSVAAELEAQLAMEDDILEIDSEASEDAVGGMDGDDNARDSGDVRVSVSTTSSVGNETMVDDARGDGDREREQTDAQPSPFPETTKRPVNDTSVIRLESKERGVPVQGSRLDAGSDDGHKTGEKGQKMCGALSGNATYDAEHAVCDDSTNGKFGQKGNNVAVDATRGSDKRSQNGEVPVADTPTAPPSSPPLTVDFQIPSPGSNKKGPNVYETLVQELRGTKAQQKAITKSFELLAKNFELLSEELSAATASSALHNGIDIQERMMNLERRMDRLVRVASAHSNAAVGMLAAGLGFVTLQYLESMDGTNRLDGGKKMNDVSHAKRRTLPKLARALVAMNVLLAAGLVVKGAMTIA